MPRNITINGVTRQMTEAEETARDNEEAVENGFDAQIKMIREKRNQLIAESDWMGNSDVTMSSEWTTYRQNLRDITNGVDTVEKINNITWPTKPSS
tara:strand:- start:27 stop:314 length:288 start_codon:yes stop_codon:yes gene_type:complete